DILHTPNPSIHTNFYDLGGDSLRAIQVFQRLEEVGAAVPLETLLGHHTIADLAELLGGDTDEAAPDAAASDELAPDAVPESTSASVA
ncbi:acyl carrier protein, partial [Streptomyces triticagri]